MRTATRYASRKVSSPAVPLHTLILLVGLGLAICVMIWSLSAVHRGEALLHTRRLGETEIVLAGGATLKIDRLQKSRQTPSSWSHRSSHGGGRAGSRDSRTSSDTDWAQDSSSTGSSFADSISSTSAGTTATTSSSGGGDDSGTLAGGAARPVLASTIPGREQCHLDDRNEYHGDVVVWGDRNMKMSAEECCQSCSEHPDCNIWVFCGREEGCGPRSSQRPRGECWLKRNSLSAIMANYGQGHSGIAWTAGAVYSTAEYEQYVKEHEATVKAEADRLAKLRDDPELPLVWMDVALNGTALGRIEMVLFAKDAPRAAENMRLLCSGELGQDPSGREIHLKGAYFYRIIDRFIDQTGAEVDGIYGGAFHDDPGGLKLTHSHKGLLSMANMGPNTNGGHFSLIMGPAHHLDGSYTIFGEIVSGIEHAERINGLAKGQPNNELLHSRLAQIVDAGQARPGAHVTSPAYQAVLQAEKRRIEYRRHMPAAEVARLQALYDDTSLPLVYLDVAIKGVYAGRIDAVLFARDSPLATENFRLLCTGEAGAPYHFKGSYFYRIVDGFVDQGGPQEASPLGGRFRDDPAGLKINHTHTGLLSMANSGPNTNGASFFILMNPAPHLDGGYTVFGEIVDGHNIAWEINRLAHGATNRELLGSKDAQIIDSGVSRRGSYLDDPAYKEAVAAERQRIAGGAAAAAAGASQ